MAFDWKQIDKVHGPTVWRVVYRILQSHPESLDCYQNVMLEAFQQSKKKAIRNWPGYLKWLAVRRSIDRIRERQRNRDRIDMSKCIESVAISSSSISSSLEMEELQARLKTELTSLPDLQAEAFWLRFIEQMSYAEIAEQMNMESQAVGVLIHRARVHVRNALADLQQTIGGKNERAIKK